MDDRRVYLVTGSRKGIGRYLAESYLEEGGIVIGCSRETPDWTHERYSHFTLDVADEKEAKKLFRYIVKEFGRLDVLINNAGIASMNHSALTPLTTARALMETNFLGTFLFCREAVRVMQRSYSARIVNFTTVASAFRLEGEAVYAASKSAVEMLTRILAKEFAAFGVTVNAVGPAPIETDLVRNIPAGKLKELLEHQAIQRFGTLEDVKNVIDFFIRQQSSFVTGQILYLGGAG